MFREHKDVHLRQIVKGSKYVAKYADMFSAMGKEPRLRIMQLLLSAHPAGFVVGKIQGELGIPNSTLSHHLEKLKNENLVCVQRKGTFLQCSANTEVLRELLIFLYSECCTQNKSRSRPERIIQRIKPKSSLDTRSMDKIYNKLSEEFPASKPSNSKLDGVVRNNSVRGGNKLQ